MPEDRDIEVAHDAHSFAAELRRLADALEGGADYTIHLDGEDVTIPADALFSVAHEREDGEVELEFQATWSTLADDDEDTDEAEEDEEEEDEDAGEEEEPDTEDAPTADEKSAEPA
jgi:amphi-Trp domain-containing protein